MAAPLTRQAIVEATRSLIETDGLDAVSLRRVAGALDVTAPALYAYVQDKRDLLRGVAEGEFARLTGIFEQIDDPDPIERIRRSSRAYVRYACEQPDLWRAMFLFPPELPISANTGAELPDSTKTFERAITDSAEAIELGLFKPGDPVVIAVTLWACIHGIADVLLLGFGFDDKTRDQLTESAIETVIAGLRA